MDPMDTSEDITLSNNSMMKCLESVLQNIRDETETVVNSSTFIAEQSQEIMEKVADKSKGVKISRPIPKLYRDKYAIWFEVENETDRSFKNFNFSLHWNSNDELTYLSSMHPITNNETKLNDSLVYCDELSRMALLVVVIDRPIFVKELSIGIDGILSYSDESGKKYVEDIPTIVIGSEDVTDGTVYLSPLQGDPNIINFYTRLICSFKFDLVIQLGTDENLAHLLESANLVPLNPVAGVPTRYYGIFGRSHLFDGTILEVTLADVISDITDISVYTKDVDSLLAYFHYLYQSIKPLCLLPSEYKIRFPSTFELRPEQNLAECIAKEIEILKLLADHSNFDEYRNNRRKLVDIEYETDLAFVRCLVANDKDGTVISVGSKCGEDNEVIMDQL